MSDGKSCELDAREIVNGVGAWVKTPGLHPQESGALNYLTLEQLHKLKQRVEGAISKAEEKAFMLAGALPGNTVRLKRAMFGAVEGTRGVIVERHGVLGGEFASADSLPVAFDGVGLRWVPVTALVLQPGLQNLKASYYLGKR